MFAIIKRSFNLNFTTMSFLDIAKNRYTTKKYNSSKRIPNEKIKELKQVLRLSPSSINSQPWKFVFIEDENTKNELASVSYFNEHKVNDSSHLVIFYAIDNIAKFEEQIEQYLPEVAVTYYNTHIKLLPEFEIKSWLQHQVYLSLGFFLGACSSMGIDSTPMEGIQKEGYDRIIHLDGYKPLFAVALGYRAEDDSNQPTMTAKSRLPIENIIKTI